MPAFLAMIPLKDWLYCGLIAAILVGGFWYHHKLIGEGIAEQRQADSIASATIAAQTAKETADLQARAMAAEQAYDKERAANQNYSDAHPVAPVRLCLGNSTRSGIVPQADAAHTGDASPGPGAATVPDMSSGDNSGRPGTPGPDIEFLLSALAQSADAVSAELREFQTR